MKKEEYIKGIQAGDKRILSKAITLAESSLHTEYELALDIVEHFNPITSSQRIGFTGTPGAGKSTFIDAYGQYLIERNSSNKIAVLTIDPSSSLSGGSILGDKTRMAYLSKKDQAFIRPTASGSHSGGLARSTRLSILLCEAAGYENIFIESVGVGQGETEIAQLSDLFVLILNPGGGDELQGIKRGIVEMADIILVNKSDGDAIQIAKNTASDYKNAQQLMPATQSGWKPEVIICSALEKTGLDQFQSAIDHYFKSTGTEFKNHKRFEQQEYWVFKHLEDLLKSRFKSGTSSIAEELKSGSLPERVALKLSKDFFI